MRRGRAAFATGLSCLACVFANGSAKADVFDFSFGPGVLGTFTTGSAASDPSYQLITGLTFGLLSGVYEDGFPFSFANLVGEAFQAGAAFNPKTGAFMNNSTGGPYDNVGDFFVQGGPTSGSIQGESFTQGAHSLRGRLVNANGGADEFEIEAPLVIALQVATPVAELSTWAMTMLGFGGLGFAARRARLAHSR